MEKARQTIMAAVAKKAATRAAYRRFSTIAEKED